MQCVQKYSVTIPNLPSVLGQSRSQTREYKYRLAMATFWRTFHHDGKFSPGWWGCVVHALPLSLYLPSQAKLWCTLQLRGQIRSSYLSSTLFLLYPFSPPCSRYMYTTEPEFVKLQGAQESIPKNDSTSLCSLAGSTYSGAIDSLESIPELLFCTVCSEVL